MNAVALYILITIMPGANMSRSITVSAPVTLSQCIDMERAVKEEFNERDYWVKPETSCRKLGSNQGNMPEL
ncbi:hypothetical protein uav_032 [Pseudomonas phage UAVern]|uniref:Uncharacterized protein n=1 Tax=Pseudomonas phage UAVern TaxID=2856997 RepID=A0A975YZ65_9CAUD|nr:hypothetical protein uav_032 [Pseudomonas phage UAVern]